LIKLNLLVLKKIYGKFQNKTIYEYTITNCNNFSVSILSYGATISKLFTKDKNHNLGDIVLGFRNLDGYLQKSNRYFGSTIGRYANRISNSSFKINDKTYYLSNNNNGASLHGGFTGFDKVIWQLFDSTENSLSFNYLSKDSEEGYPGNLNVNIKYTLNNFNELEIEYSANTDKPTFINLTNHTYFNLNPEKFESIKYHELTIFANKYIEIDKQLIPTGQILNTNNKFNFTKPRLLNSLFNKGYEYDNCWILNDIYSPIKHACVLYHPITGRRVDIYTTKPGLQFYSGNFLNGNYIQTKNNEIYNKQSGLCLEPQFYPDSPNFIHFSNSLLNPNETYFHKSIYKFTY